MPTSIPFTMRAAILFTLTGLACATDPVKEPTQDNETPDSVLQLEACDSTPSLSDATAFPLDDVAAMQNTELMCALRAIDPLVADASIICSGENHHGVAQSSWFHAALARYLVHQHNVRTILLESPDADIAPWDRYLTSNAPADLEKGFASSSPTFADVIESESLVMAFRDIQNELNPGDTLTLGGFDVSVQTQNTRERLVQFMQIVEPDEEWESALSEDASDFTTAATNADTLQAQLLANQIPYTEATSAIDWGIALRDVMNLADGLRFRDEFANIGFPLANANHREPGMVRNVESYAASARGKVLIISHNWHCAKNVTAGTFGSLAMGSQVSRDRPAGEYITLAQFYGSGERLSRTGGAFAATPFSSPANGIENALESQSALEQFIIGTEDTWALFDQSLPALDHPTPFTASEQFDGVVYLRSVGATTPR